MNDINKLEIGIKWANILRHPKECGSTPNAVKAML